MPLLGRRRPPRNPNDLIDRDPQNLSIPLGGFAPVRQRRRSPTMVKFWRRNAAGIVSIAGLALAAAGALISITQPPVPVYLRAGSVHVGSAVLTHPADNAGQQAPAQAYTGSAVMILVVNADGSAKASAVTDARGKVTSGACLMAPPSEDSVTETCSFTVGSEKLTSSDVLDLHRSGQWTRTYSDGTTVAIGVPNAGAAIPVPFAIGR